MDNYIFLSDVSKSFNGRVILSNVTLQIQKGTATGIVGANGSGKSVLFKIISGLYRPDAGYVSIRGAKLGQAFDFPPDMGIFIDSPGFISIYTGFQNLKCLADIRGKICDADIKKAMLSVGLVPDDKTRVKNYSLGMKQKLGIAQAIMEGQDILLFDEPFNALDSASHDSMLELVCQLKREQKTIILTSHNNLDITTVCDAIYQIENGEICKITQAMQ